MGTCELNAGGNPVMDNCSIPCRGEEKILLLVASCYRNWNKLQPDGPRLFYADVTLHAPVQISLGYYSIIPYFRFLLIPYH